MKYICFAATPLQLICIKELLYQKKINQYIVYLLKSPNANVNQQNNQTIKFLNLKNIKKYRQSSIKIINIFQRIIFLFKLIYKYKKIKTAIVIADFLNMFTHYLRCVFKNSKFILVDDGFATYWLYKKYMQKRIFFPVEQFKSFFGKLNKFFIFNFQFEYLMLTKFEIFTIYAKELGLTNDSFNNLQYMKSFLVKKPKLKYSKSLIYLVGTKFFESGRLTLDAELAMISKVNIYWKKKGKKLLYVAKRTTSKYKINKIEDKLHIKVITSNLPLELSLMSNRQKKIPSIICSFGSTADKTIPMIYKNVKVYYAIIDELKNNKNFSNKISFYTQFMLKAYSSKYIIRLKSS
jgi:hypothetical protein